MSPVLWRKVKPSLSAGRVQSVAVRLIVEREREIQKFEGSSFYKVIGQFRTNEGGLKADYSKQFKSEKEVNSFIDTAKSTEFSVRDVIKSRNKTVAPFTTSTLQQEASLKLGFSVTRTMSVAQRLYEAGRITYMRTDSVNLSDTALTAAKNEITKAYGDEYVEIRKYSTKSSGAQEAHEAIRPTDFAQHRVDAENDEARLYELIWKRAIASQMVMRNWSVRQ